MSSISQQNNFTTGQNVTATILNTEFSNIVTNINNIYSLIDDSTGNAPITAITGSNPGYEIGNDYAMLVNTDGNYCFYQGGVSGTLKKIIVPTTGDIQAAINENVSLVQIMPGEHVITSEISIPNKNITIEGWGTAATKIVCTSNISRIFNIARTISHLVEIKNFSVVTTNGSGTFDGVIFDFTTSGFYDSMNIENIEIDCDVTHTNRRIIDTTGGGEYRAMNIDIRIKSGTFNTAINLNDVRASYIKCISDVFTSVQDINLDSNSDRNIVIACNMSVNDSGTANQLLYTP